MDITTAKTENLTELLMQILDFTEQRKEILFRNIFERSNPGFVPQDLPAAEFAHCMTRALCEHLCRNRLLFCDSSHIRFETNGNLKVEPLTDSEAHLLLRNNPPLYLQMQIQKLSENLLNNRIAAELLSHIKSKTAAAR
ncbi:MAG TPA: hypothetical protein PK054_04395 [Anaerohalosphaeraceae bacterium]|nr:hypothetical protein [Anaerohalosphaeraceae bacterium]HOL87689.1 hypothetical protein [Anaerohalosphaeraceae bacterium]HPP55803.1 hypothetical protein [Anaerohalosphaeraceae bacterium]